MTPLYGHTSEATARLVPDYPYGGKRTEIRFWIEQDPKKGFRFVSQTKNPKNGVWNNPKKGTYCSLAMCLYLDEKGHVTHKSLTEYSNAEDILDFLTNFPEAPIHSNLKMTVALRKKMTERTVKGEANFKIGGVPQKPSEADIEKAKQELEIWEKITTLLLPKF